MESFNENLLLFIEPKLEDKHTEIKDSLVMIMLFAISKGKKGIIDYRSNNINIENFEVGGAYRGFHTNCDGETSANYEILLENGLITNSLAPHYLKYFRNSIPKVEIEKLKSLVSFYKEQWNNDWFKDIPVIEKVEEQEDSNDQLDNFMDFVNDYK